MKRTIEHVEVLICGAGIAGLATAFFLARRHGIKNVVVVDDRPPLSLTSDKSSEGYRNWWLGPDDAMIRLMNRSIDLLEELARESDNRIHLNKRGYVYLTANAKRAELMAQQAMQISQFGAGPLRIDGAYKYSANEPYDSALDGADLVYNKEVIQANFPFLANDTLAMLHARRCGWLSAQQLGIYLLEQARSAGVRLINGRVMAVTLQNNCMQTVHIQSADGQRNYNTDRFVIAAGPMLQEVTNLLNIRLPVYNELHGKVAFEDSEGIIDRNAPLMIWNDPIHLPWSETDKADLILDKETSWLLDEFPPGLHFRPEGGPGSKTILALWPYHIIQRNRPQWPISFEADFVEIIMRGLTCMIPELGIYLDRMSPPVIDGGYYTKTRENRPLIGPLPISGAYVIGALSGFGIMAAPAAAELVSAHIAGESLPDYAGAFDLARYRDPAYQDLFKNWDPLAGQL
ncbi:MAG: NAD(P)/FAD-dependent oxidoreductase [Candidatus Promineifilaceae bacterium]|jgi:glycine/D-amino acid oxidase-like deaminating enzyme